MSAVSGGMPEPVMRIGGRADLCHDCRVPELRSLDRLDLDRSWARVLSWVRRRIGDVPDRLQYELFDRAGSIELQRSHDVQPAYLVPATKGGHQTVRPFVRAHARDVLLYWALVDAASEAIECSLGSSDRIFANRWTPICEDVTPAPEPNWTAFEQRMETEVFARPTAYVLRADVSSFYMAISIDRLVRVLLELGVSGAVTTDLHMLMTTWHAQGIRGLPQGLPPSGPLANAYLLFADQMLERSGVDFIRYSDDVTIFCDTFAEARQTLDGLERQMYARGLTLGGEKTRILRASTLIGRLGTEGERTRREMAEFAGDYDWNEQEVSEAERQIAVDAFDGAVTALSHDRYERSEFIFAFRLLGRLRDPHPLAQLPAVLIRMPGLTGEAMAYVSALGARDRPDAMTAVERALASGFHRDQEWLHILRALTALPGPGADATLASLASVATEHSHPLVRARAMLAWCRQSPPDQTAVAEEFFARERRMWKAWAIMAIRDKHRRDELYERWNGEGRSIARLIESLSAQPLGWSKT